jgi:predicted alpha/beta superfamily hydrolase
MKNTSNTAKISASFFRALAICSTLLLSLSASSQVLDSSRMDGPEGKIFNSRILGEKRKIRIQVPSGMNHFDAYPVLYVLDGEAQTNLVTGEVQYLSESYKIIPNMIVVSIENTDRMRDLTPTHPLGADGKPDTAVASPFRTTGGGENFLRFMKEELFPYIEGRYKTVPYRILSGHSLGGLMAVYCLAHHPDYFNAYIAVSPSLQWDNNVILKQLEDKPATKLFNKLLFFSDANEDLAFHQNQLKLDSLLLKKAGSGITYKRMFYPEETHISEPVKAFYDGIRFIYPGWHLPYNSSAFRKTMTASIIMDHYTQLSKHYGYHVIPLHDEIIPIARFLRNDPARRMDAIELLEMNARNYPTSPITFELLGDTFLLASDKVKAGDAFEKALALDPGNQKIQQKLKSVQ